MNIELKNIQINYSMSEETVCFSASLYINGQKVATASNNGRGCPTSYNALHQDYFQAIRNAEEYCETLPPERIKISEKREFTMPMTLERFIDNIVCKIADEQQDEKFKKKMEKDQVTAIIYGNDRQYSSVYWPMPSSKRKRPLADIMSNKDGIEMIKKQIAKIKSEMPDGHRILNTNIPKEIM